MTTSFMDVDVRPTLRAGGEPFGEIMAAIAKLQPGQGLRLLATFEPVPLFHVLGSKGFSHKAKEIGGGDWEVLFSPAAAATPADATPAKPASDTSAWPSPVQEMDNRDLDPPEPMVRILAAVEAMAPGEVLFAVLSREPVFLFPELTRRGHQWAGNFDETGTAYRILVRIGEAKA